ncbi:type I-E CRISPR-associated protein Cas6/Cse3/CasE [Streptomyces nitrosporeus]|uniref:Type I-E CRISPR-associated protein Cas6/Cse3/CasE n=1 Tax=Streptomyces nitrosporeus TaxID=28894 RepID=A0A5J6FG35_9ACTN|nr:type I-E CRISPR-associated protein Cas6/Cse3/CasE [Streptomyces nitrosporeus]QEU74444.1 type I-E CRISPR-associated protein Cas6/Cse3/CasE [Streptomyces nitrosporeus]GGY83089.1 type I-E CRISPR-associated protein Cas6/Cse3/CasE [Streptomyces nitrosporeus]
MTAPRATAARFVATQTLLTLDARHPYVAKSLIDAQDMHRNVMSGFRGWVDDGSRDARAQMGVLSAWTLDLREARLSLVVQSRVPGDWNLLPRAALVEEPETLTLDRTFGVGDVVDFRTVVNPVYSRPPAPGATERTRGQRVAHTRPDHVKAWFVRRLQPPHEAVGSPGGPARLGADAHADDLAVRMLPRISSPASHKGLRLVRAEIRGKLTVTAPDTFVDVLTNGLGHGRAYGCGLLLVR